MGKFANNSKYMQKPIQNSLGFFLNFSRFYSAILQSKRIGNAILGRCSAVMPLFGIKISHEIGSISDSRWTTWSDSAQITCGSIPIMA